MQVVHVVESLDRGGLERMVCDLALEQQRRGLAVEVFCLFTSGSFAVELRAANVPVHEGGKSPGLDWALIRRLRAAIRRSNHRLVHTHNPVANYYACLAELTSWRRVRIVNTRHNMGARDPDDRREKLFRLSLARTSKVAMVSPQVCQRFVESGNVPSSKAAVVMNGIPVDRYPAIEQRTRLRARGALGLPTEAIVLGTVGRLVDVKNHALFLKAAADLCHGRPELRLVLVGTGELEGALQSLARDLGIERQVVLTGERDDVPALLHAFDVFVLPSRSEGHSVALLEAACTGLPLVATDVGGNSEIVRHGHSGMLVPSDDEGSMRTTLRVLIEDQELRGRLGHQSRSWALETVSTERMAQSYFDLYRSVLGEPA